jgi:NAD(P)-dependent dehydrogenase (short-subunit alcohol dehydrogenase family)
LPFAAKETTLAWTFQVKQFCLLAPTALLAALVKEALKRDASRVHAATRQRFRHSDERVMPVILDVTNTRQIQACLEKIESLDLVINNAGVNEPRFEPTALCSNSTWRSTCSARSHDSGVAAVADPLQWSHRQ